jgi:hypothetical protein
MTRVWATNLRLCDDDCVQNLVVDIRGGLLQPLDRDESDETAKPLLVLAYYRNQVCACMWRTACVRAHRMSYTHSQLLQWFYVEGIVAIALNSFDAGGTRSGACAVRIASV